MKRRITIVVETEYPSGKVSRVAETFDELSLAVMREPMQFLLDLINKLLKQSKDYIP